MNRRAKFVIAPAALLLSVVGLSACSGGGKSSATSTTASATASASAGQSGAARGAGGAFNNPAVTKCLKAAGLTLPTGRPGFRPSGSGFPSGSRPSGSRFPSGSRPSGGFPSGSRRSGAGGFGGNSAQAKKIQAALKACGITLPTGGFRGRSGGASGSATPSATPTS